MTAGLFPTPPTFAALESWAGAGRVIRADKSMLADWRLPGQQQATLVSCGVPLLDGVVDVVSFTTEPTRYRLAAQGHDRSSASYAAERETGRVVELTPSGDARVVNSSVTHWLCSLHLVGTWLATSTAAERWDEDDALEELALTELADLAQRIAHLDPPAYGTDGDHRTHFWPAVLDRWLY
ncbi:SUKH-4 family immunity protein [Actinophytocola sediminis]